MSRRGIYNNHQQENKFQELPEVKESIELMVFLTNCFPGKSRTSIKSLLAHKQVLVNQQPVTRYNYPVKPGDRVAVVRGKTSEPNDLTGVNILFEDDYFIVVEKVAGLLTMGTSGEKERTAYHILSNYLKTKNPPKHLFILHRLDRDTSGVMMFAKDQQIQTTMQNNWREMVVERTYTVIVEGKVLKAEGTISSHLIESKAMKIHTTSKPETGQLAVTYYKLKKQIKDYALLEVTLETGRKNQIRVHMEEMGNPVAGDKKYGAKTNPLHRLGLHASILIFKHPVTKEILRFESPLPKSFLRLMK